MKGRKNKGERVVMKVRIPVNDFVAFKKKCDNYDMNGTINRFIKDFNSKTPK